MKPIEVRAQLVNALRLDLVGPENDSELATEVLPQAPSRWYLTGFLVPLEAGEAQRQDETAEEELDLLGGDSEATDDATTPEPPAARRAYFPSSIGLSLLVPQATRQLRVLVRWGDYRLKVPETQDEGEDRSTSFWQRTPREVELSLVLPLGDESPRGTGGSRERRAAHRARGPPCPGVGDCRRHGSRRYAIRLGVPGQSPDSGAGR